MMQQELEISDRTAGFTCPRCGASAFEVTGLDHQVNLDVELTRDMASFLCMHCLCCRHEFKRVVHEYSPEQMFTEFQANALVGSTPTCFETR